MFCQSALQRLRQHAWEVVFLGALCAYVVPLWIGDVPPLSDFMGHAAMAQVWVTHNTNPAYAQEFVKAPWASPNMLPIHFAAALHPLLPVVTSLRLWLTVTLLLTGLSLIYLCRASQRHPALLCFALPFTWHSNLSMGFVNFLPVLPLLFLALGMTLRARRHSWMTWMLQSAALSQAAYWVHGMGWAIIAGFVGLLGLMVMSLRRVGLTILAWLPSAGLWLAWYMTTRQRQARDLAVQGTLPSLNDALQLEYPQAIERFASFIRGTADIVTSSRDTNLVFCAFCALLAALALQGQQLGRQVTQLAEDEEQRELSRWTAGLQRSLPVLRENSMLMVALVAAVATYALPTSVNGVVLAARFLPVFFLLLPFCFRAGDVNIGVRAFSAVAAVLSVALAINLMVWSYRFNRQEIRPLLAALAEVEAPARVDCVGMDWIPAVFLRWPLTHTCRGLVHTENQGISGGGFARDAFNAIRFAPGVKDPHMWPGELVLGAKAQAWDYVLTRNIDELRPDLYTPVARYTHAKNRGPVYSLYKVRRTPQFVPGYGFWRPEDARFVQCSPEYPRACAPLDPKAPREWNTAKAN